MSVHRDASTPLRALALLASAWLTPLSHAQDATPYAPSAVPDRIVLTWSGDPATSQSVTWRTDTSVGAAYAEVAVATDGPEFRKNASRTDATTSKLDTDDGAAHYHSITFAGLQPSTRYCYRVGDGKHWSEWSHFTTASASAKPFSFVYFGDAQNNLKAHWSRVVREGFRDAPRAAFLLHAGDLVNRANRDREWGEWFYAAGWILRTVPSIPTPGNHEYARPDKKSPRTLTSHWRPTFTLPGNGPKGLEETVYWLDYQGARIVSLNTNESLEAQAEWFEEVWEQPGAHGPPRWRIVTMHHPVFSTAKKRDNPKVRATLQPLFDKHRIDLVLQGHDHAYGRSDRIRHLHQHAHGEAHNHGPAENNVPTGLRAQDGEFGTVYVVSVSGPKMYRLDKQPVFVKAAQNKQLYQVISIDGDVLSYSARTATGTLFDQFELRKGEGGANQLVETKR